MNNIIVCKFGGSSVAKEEDIKRIRKISRDNMQRRVIVVSAPGKTSAEDEKVTDMLIRAAKTKEPSLAEKVMNKYRAMCPEADIAGLARLLEQRLSCCFGEAGHIDAVKAFGEEANARIAAGMLCAEYVDPEELLLVSEDYGNARILARSENKVKKRLADRGKLYVIPGFYGYTAEGRIATFSRGGSDLTGAYICAALEAKIYENFTDRDGIYAADPEIIKNPVKIKQITFNEMRDLAYSGFKIFHESAVGPLAKKRIPVHVRNAFSYPVEGTYICYDRQDEPNRPIVGVAYKGGLCCFDTARFGLNDTLGIGRRILRVFEQEGASVEFITTGIDDMSVILREEQLKGSQARARIKEKLRNILGSDASIEFQKNIGSLVVAGKGLRGNKGISAGIQSTLADAGVNIKFISQGPQERSIIYGIESQDSSKAVRAVYSKYLI